MKTIQINVPNDIGLNDYDFSMILAAKLYEDAKLSAGLEFPFLVNPLRIYIMI